MKGQWESNINVSFPFIYSQKWNCAASLFPKQNYNDLSPSSYTHISVKDLHISRIGLILLQPNMWTDPGNISIAHRHMNVEIGTGGAQFPVKSHINGIFVAVQITFVFVWSIIFVPHCTVYARLLDRIISQISIALIILWHNSSSKMIPKLFFSLINLHSSFVLDGPVLPSPVDLEVLRGRSYETPHCWAYRSVIAYL